MILTKYFEVRKFMNILYKGKIHLWEQQPLFRCIKKKFYPLKLSITHFNILFVNSRNIKRRLTLYEGDIIEVTTQ